MICLPAFEPYQCAVLHRESQSIRISQVQVMTVPNKSRGEPRAEPLSGEKQKQKIHIIHLHYYFEFLE